MIQLQLHDSNNIIDADFGKWLIQKIRLRLLSNINKYNFKKWDTYLSESDSIPRLYTKSYYASEVIIFAANNLECKATSGNITICVNNNKLSPGFDRVKVSTLIKTINYGTLHVKGCPIFTDTFNHFAENIDTYASIYYRI